jgi:hypothetical protein
MFENNNNNNKDNDINYSSSPDDIPTFNKAWIIEWHSKIGRTSAEEKDNYPEALEFFSKKTKEGKNTMLYEVQKSPYDGKIIKKTPILNSSKDKERKRNLQNDIKEPTTIKKDEGKFSSRKSRFIILLAIIVALIVTIYIITIISGGTSSSSHHIIVETIKNGIKDATINNILNL